MKLAPKTKTLCLVVSFVIFVLLVTSAILPFFSAQPTVSGLPLRSIWESYLIQLNKRPLFTKCVTSFVGFCLGDVAAQVLSDATNYDFMRSFRMALYGGVIAGPLAHYWFNLLDTVVLPSRPFSLAAIITKAMLDQLVQAPIGISIFYAYQETMQGRINKVGDVIKNKLLPTLFLTWKFWPLAHLINFAFIPLQQRILYVNVVSVVYTCLLSRLAAEKPGTPAQKVNVRAHT